MIDEVRHQMLKKERESCQDKLAEAVSPSLLGWSQRAWTLVFP